ncbi:MULTISPECIES: hypothetical protein [unclassified Klebsiella]|uniref:hypothetical protein n=1 Tax=Klebsiella TaxID=570 RepID=UPI0032B5F7B6
MPIIGTLYVVQKEHKTPVDIHLENTEEGEYVYYTADASIDADGANGQNGSPAAYQINDHFKEIGSDRLVSLNLKIDSNGVFHKINPTSGVNAILESNGQPKIFPQGIIASKTSLHYQHISLDDPKAYIDAATVLYIAVPKIVIAQTKGTVIGCQARVTWKDKSINCVVADSSGNGIGELSIAAAEALGVSGNPRHGGIDEIAVRYEIWPGKATPGFPLLPTKHH